MLYYLLLFLVHALVSPRRPVKYCDPCGSQLVNHKWANGFCRLAKYSIFYKTKNLSKFWSALQYPSLHVLRQGLSRKGRRNDRQVHAERLCICRPTQSQSMVALSGHTPAIPHCLIRLMPRYRPPQSSLTNQPELAL